MTLSCSDDKLHMKMIMMNIQTDKSLKKIIPIINNIIYYIWQIFDSNI